MAAKRKGPARATEASRNDFIIGAVVLLAIIVVTNYIVRARVGISANSDSGVTAGINYQLSQQSGVVPSDTPVVPIEAGITTQVQSPTSWDGRYTDPFLLFAGGIGGNVPSSSN